MPVSNQRRVSLEKRSFRDRHQVANSADRVSPKFVTISRLARSTLKVLEIPQEAAKKGIAVDVVKSKMVMDGSLNSKITAVVLVLAAEIEHFNFSVVCLNVPYYLEVMEWIVVAFQENLPNVGLINPNMILAIPYHM